MINYDSILSAFDGKPTLLQWLKMVKKALDESVLKDVTIAKDGDNIAFTFNFEDGTSVTTPKVTLPKGDKGDKGNDGVSIVSFQTGSYIVSGNLTDTNINAVLSNGENKKFVVHAQNGKNIIGIDTLNDEVVGDKTLTTLRANYSDATSDEFVVMAKNGSEGNIYLHSVNIKSTTNFELYFNLYSRKETLTIDDFFAQIPTNNPIPMCFKYIGANAVLSVKKVLDTNGDYITAFGVGVSNGKAAFYDFVIYKKDATFTDTLLGRNL